jgi:protoporphyrinogen oxidase
VAERLRQAQRDVVVLEKEPVVGGLCRSYRYGDFVFDIGPHRLFSSQPAIRAQFLGILGEQAIVSPRCSQVFIENHYLDWPLSLAALFRLPLRDTLSCFRDLVRNNNHVPLPAVRNLEEYVVARYGSTIFNIFWKEYTEKFLGMPCREVDAEWGMISVERSVIDRKTQLNGLLDLARNCIRPQRQRLKFLYPRGGMGVFPELWVDLLRRQGGVVKTAQRIVRLETRNGSVTRLMTAEDEYAVDQLIWTGSLTDLCRLLGEPAFPLQYLSTLLYNFEIEGELPGDWQWIYFPDGCYCFSRISRPARFDAQAAPPGRTGLCVELSCLESSREWAEAEQQIGRVSADLQAVRLIRNGGQVRGCHVERVANSYPIYRLGFRRQVEAVQARLARFANLHLVGRQAMFVHDNIDEALESAAAAAAKLVTPGS